MRPLLVSCLVLVSCGAKPVPKAGPIDFDSLPGQTVFSAEATLLDRWKGPLKTSFEAGVPGAFSGVAGVEIAYRIFKVPTPTAAIVLLTGRTEPIRKYAELIDDLTRAGYSVYAMDHRGQGASGRLLPNREKGHVENFDDYVTDVHTFVSTVVRPDTNGKVFLIAQSMGGAVGLMDVGAHREDFDAVVASSPMLEIDTGSFPAPIASTLGTTACSATDGTAYAVGSSDFKQETDFSKSTVTQSMTRFEWKRVLYEESPELRIGGLTWKWLCEALAGSSYAEQLGRTSITPTLIIQAGQDRIVKPGGQERYCKAAPLCQLTRIDDAMHEHFAEKDALRNKALERTLKFFDLQVAP